MRAPQLKKTKLNPKNKKVTDPPRYPKVIVPYETKAKQIGKEMVNKTMVDITKTMVRIVKENNEGRKEQ